MTDSAPVERRREQRRADDRRDERRENMIRTALTVAAVVAVIAAAVFGSWAADRINNGPVARDAAEQSAENGESLCDISRALSHVVVVFADAPNLTDDQRAALDELDAVADRCAGTDSPTTTEAPP